MGLTLTFPVNTTGSADTVQILIELAGGGGNVAAHSQGVHVNSLGKLSSVYRLDDPLIVPSNLQIELFDSETYLKPFLFPPQNDDRARIQVEINGSPEFVGFLVDEGIFYDEGNKILRMNFYSNVVALNEVILVGEAGDDGVSTWVDPLSWGAFRQSFSQMVEDIFNLVSQSAIGLTLNHAWDFAESEGQPTVNLSAVHIIPSQVVTGTNVTTGGTFNRNPAGILSMGDFLRHLSFMLGSFTGLVDNETAFFTQLFNSGTPTQSLGTVLNATWQQEFGLTRYVKVTSEAVISSTLTTRNYISGVPTISSREEVGSQVWFDSITPFDVLSSVLSNSGGSTLYSWVDWPPLSTTLAERTQFGQFVTKFWEFYKSKLSRMFTLSLLVEGLAYRLDRNFTHNTDEYQTIGVIKDLDRGVTTLKGIKVN